ncbi:hypothetical protein EJ06DRAFT_357431 [Trichodelitschia bisporula]|uniref:Uncharacterized protein n=1 Tax=Trichodelitschia bisporula TaxID=703511 RepID=A0A6G1I0E8_9PEZI|nr:hypothetical protein EJ06DRAFT_357431 [Trichodelitschia bisporula]
MKWHLGGKQERVDELRASLASHVEKISLFTESETLQVLLDLKEDVGALRDDVEKLPDRVYRQFRAAAASDGRSSTSTGLLSLSQEICTRYEEGLDINAPPTYITGSDFPLKEGLDALMGAYQKSTVDFSKSALRIWGPPVEQWNNLFKAGFIFERMVSSKYLREAGQDSLWRWALESFYKKLRTEFARFEDDLEAGERDVLQLSPEYFQIWPAEVKRKRPQDKLTEAQEGELKVLQVQLEDPDERVRKDLVAFRRLHKDFTELRVVTVHSLKDPSTSEILIAPDDGNKVAKVHNVSIIPKYAYPLGYRVRPSKIIEVCFPGASRGFDYPFKMHEELLMFQQTWLGYKVVYEDPGCAYTVHYSHGLFSSKNLKGIGRVQIWQPKELPPIGPPASPNPDPRTPRARADSLYSQTNFTLRSSDSYSTVTGSSKGHSKPKAAKRPPSPVVVIFTETEAQAGQPSEPMVLFLRLEDNHQTLARLVSASSSPPLVASSLSRSFPPRTPLLIYPCSRARCGIPSLRRCLKSKMSNG